MCLDEAEVVLRLYVRFGNREEEILDYPVYRPKGRVIYTLINEDYVAKNGICTYKAEILSDGHVAVCWHHQLWTELIDLQTSSTCVDDVPECQ